MAGKLIILNGTSSSGKSSIARKLQNEIEENYLVIGVDLFMRLMPERFANINKLNGKDQEFGFSFSYDNNGHLEKINITDIGYRYTNRYSFFWILDLT
jgi:chloramphenicol 3-O phosphotransferase